MGLFVDKILNGPDLRITLGPFKSVGGSGMVSGTLLSGFGIEEVLYYGQMLKKPFLFSGRLSLFLYQRSS